MHVVDASTRSVHDAEAAILDRVFHLVRKATAEEVKDLSAAVVALKGTSEDERVLILPN